MGRSKVWFHSITKVQRVPNQGDTLYISIFSSSFNYFIIFQLYFTLLLSQVMPPQPMQVVNSLRELRS